jgi:hypothetical protein
MKFFHAVVAIVWSLVVSSTATTDGYTDEVTWDGYSIVINGTRQFIMSVH